MAMSHHSSQQNSSQQIIVDIYLSADQYQHFYDGSIRYVKAVSIDGRSLRFPASILQSFVSHHGVSGRFVIEFDGEGKFQNIERIN